MKKEKIERVVKNVGQMKEKAGQLGQDAVRTAGFVKKVALQGLEQGKQAVSKASQYIDKETLSQGAAVTSKGLDFFARGAKMASKGADSLAKAVEKVSSGIKTLSKGS